MQQTPKRGVKARRRAARNISVAPASNASGAATLALPSGALRNTQRLKAAQQSADTASSAATPAALSTSKTPAPRPTKAANGSNGANGVNGNGAKSRVTTPTDTIKANGANGANGAKANGTASRATIATSAKATATLPTATAMSVTAPEEDEAPVAEHDEELETEREPLATRFQRFPRATWDRIRSLTVEQWFWIGVILLGAVLRFWGLGDKPLHHDESMHAYFSLQFASYPPGYQYDPLLHGPFQFHAEAFVFDIVRGLQAIFVHGVSGNPWINDYTARILPATFGLGIVVLPLGLRRELGRYGALAAAFLLAVSPSFVYFSRFLREDIYFNFFMFAMVVCAVRYAHDRQMRWFIGLFAATVLAYATFEGTYLTFAIFGSFLAVLFVWELAYSVANLLPQTLTQGERLFFSRAGLLALLGAIASALGLVALRTLNGLSAYINAHQSQSDIQVQHLENTSVAVLLYGSIVVALLVIGTLIWQMYREDALSAAQPEYNAYSEDESFVVEGQPVYHSRVEQVDAVLTAPSRWARRTRDRLDPNRQHFLWTLFSTNWIYWFVAFVVCWLIFAVLYWTIPPMGIFGPGTGFVTSWGQGFEQGIGRGIWQGLYYWIEQQNVARGGQPWYYYLLLIPMYEQLAVVFGLIGVVYALVRPTRFRLFLVWWFVISLGLYSWAGEKMPWLSIHIILPLMLLAGIVVGRALEGCVAFARERLRPGLASSFQSGAWKPAVSILGVFGALVLLIPMVYGMLVLTHKDAAEGPHEMMVYVQTTQDVDSIMAYINHADQVLYGGQHKLRIAVGAGEEWPFYWYLRDYPNAVFDYPSGDPSYVAQHPVDVLLLLPAGDQNGADAQTFMAEHPTGYQQQHYKLRSWWDEGYKPLPCVQTKTHACPQSNFLLYGIGLGDYLSYGKQTGKPFNMGRAANRLWTWLWTRQALGPTDGSYDFVMIVRAGMPTPLPTPLHEQPAQP
jgi:uncharacterized protein (TIGR03663 family)